eukprot:GGOE01000682.1.p1 GENE.GGOE01000682.1~~GGOE01000682.1.p1  ORF type:complete len:365 (-),score=44.63 GGOE01000682.1:137-1099(-)
MCHRQVLLEALPSMRSLMGRLPPEAQQTRTPVTCRLSVPFQGSSKGVLHYRQLCSFEGGRYLYPTHLLPPTFLQAETYTLQATAARASGFNLAELQLVRYHMKQDRPISADEMLDVVCDVDIDSTDATSATLTTRFAASGCVVSSFATTYSEVYPEPKECLSRNWQSMGHVGSTLLVVPSLGFNYCRRGFGPFSWRHVSILTAVMSGRPHAEVPETWLAGRLLAALAGSAWLTLADGGPIEMDLHFHAPVPAPSRLHIMVAQNGPSAQQRNRRMPRLNLAEKVQLGVVEAQRPSEGIVSGTLWHPLLDANAPQGEDTGAE